MTENMIRALILEGENSWIEFKRCGNGIESDVYETVCSFSNHFGGTILCGVLDDGSIQGVSEKAIASLKKKANTQISKKLKIFIMIIFMFYNQIYWGLFVTILNLVFIVHKELPMKFVTKTN